MELNGDGELIGEWTHGLIEGILFFVCVYGCGCAVQLWCFYILSLLLEPAVVSERWALGVLCGFYSWTGLSVLSG